MSDPVETCQHVKTNGAMCDGVALRTGDYCFFHQRDRERQARIARALDHKRSTLARWGSPDGLCKSPLMPRPFDDHSAAIMQSLALPLVEDVSSIQVLISNVIRLIATQQIDYRAAGLILYGLQISSSNIKHAAKQILPDDAMYTRDPDEGDALPASKFANTLHKKPPVSIPNASPSASATPVASPLNCHPEPAKDLCNSAVSPAVQPSEFAVAVDSAVAPDQRPTTNDQRLGCHPEPAKDLCNSVASCGNSGASCLSAPDRREDVVVAIGSDQRSTTNNQRLFPAPNQRPTTNDQRLSSAKRILGRAATDGKKFRELLNRLELADAARKKSPHAVSNGNELHRSFASAPPPPQRASSSGTPEPRSG